MTKIYWNSQVRLQLKFAFNPAPRIKAMMETIFPFFNHFKANLII